LLGTGLLITGVLKNVQALQESGAGGRPGESVPNYIGAWLHLGERGTVTVFRSEMTRFWYSKVVVAG
jgi:hypothetical protein